MVQCTYDIVVYLCSILYCGIVPIKTIVSCLYYSLEYHLNVRSVNIYISLVICTNKIAKLGDDDESKFLTAIC